MNYPFEVRKVYDFSIHPSSIIPGDYSNVTILAILDPDSARQVADVDAIHVQVYPYLPVGTPDDAGSYDYVKVRLNNGTTTVLGFPWINESTIVERQAVKIYVLIDNVGTADIARIRDSLVMNGYNTLQIGTDPSAFN